MKKKLIMYVMTILLVVSMMYGCDKENNKNNT